MEKLPFNKVELLENLKIENRNEITNIKLVNKNVKILISILGGVIYLVGFYKQSLDGERGIVRCALYVLLEKLLAEGKIQKQQIMKVSAPTPDDGNIERLIKIYTDIGFKKGRPEPGNPINLYNTVVELIKTLTYQCQISGGRKRRKKSRKMKGGHHLYKRLGVSKYATQKQIKKAYNKFKKKKKLTKKVKYAYKILSKKKSRKKYNAKYKKHKKHKNTKKRKKRKGGLPSVTVKAQIWPENYRPDVNVVNSNQPNVRTWTASLAN